ncbi:hemerythrin domain-containing protein [Caenispirillum bisanense]|uniref:hemerythrin domain-containing protein n=1 Tax=Caenispirillum bisanense TaxID=414052 RepID=UPI0031D8DC2D
MSQAVQIIRQEHRNLFRVVTMLDAMLRDGREAPDLPFVRAVLDYIETFTDRFHHPKEDLHLFATLRRRDPLADAMLEELEAEHAGCPGALSRLKDTVGACERGEAGAADLLRERVAQYLRFQIRHMQKEEGVILPMAEKSLTPADWAAIDAAFADNRDPLFGAEARADMRRLYSRLVNEAPAPYGVGG